MLRIKELLKNKGITSIELAGRLGVTKTNVSYIINEKLNPKLETLQRIADILGVSVAELFDDYDKAKRKEVVSGFVKLGDEIREVSTISDLLSIIDDATKIASDN